MKEKKQTTRVNICWILLLSAGFIQLIHVDVVALSRVSSQLLKGVRAASHQDNWWMLLHWAGCLASYWRGLGQLHTRTTDGCCCIEQGVWPVILKGVRAASHLDNWWMLLHWAGCLASYWRGLGQLHTWTTDGCCCIEQGVWPVIGGLGQFHTRTTDGCWCIEQGV